MVCVLFVCVLVCYHCFSSTVATPTVEVTRVPENMTLADEALNLTCTVSLDASVNTNVTVSAVWTRGMDLASPVTMVTSGVYESVLDFGQLEMSDSGAYTCTASATPDPIDATYITASGTGEATIEITVGKCTVGCIEPLDLYPTPSCFTPLQNNTTSPSLPLLAQLLARTTL